MTAQVRLQLNYREDEVVEAQRMRFVDSSRFKLGITLAIIGTVILTAQQVYFWYDKGGIPASWFTLAIWPAIFIGVGGVVYAIAPSIDFRLNPVWKHTLEIYLTEDKLELITPGQAQGFEWQWARLKKVLENKKVYILFFSSDQEFLILPKRIFGEQDSYFQETIKRSASPIWKARL
jgi:hypothetical protein